jgi:tRNA pseudouridine55 synthase
VTDGVLVVDKPTGMTSHDVVDLVRRRLHTRKVGHGGTLDPEATGVLVVGVGRATRFLSFAQRGSKRYRATVRFGTATTTQDATGDVVERRPVRFDEPVLLDALRAFTGDIEQVPPMVSAVKIGGERLYRKARRGEEVERPARRVTVHSLQLVELSAPPAEAVLEVACSAGTYVRTLAADLGERLGSGAHLASLRRTHAGGFDESDVVGLDEIGARSLRPLVDIVRALPRLDVDDATARLVRHGRRIDASAVLSSIPANPANRVAVVHDGGLLGVYARVGDVLIPERVVGP